MGNNLRRSGGTVRRRPSDVISALQRARKGVTLGEVGLRALIDEGRA
jgi:hypothetical protein